MDKIIGLGNALVDALAIIEDDNILTARITGCVPTRRWRWGLSTVFMTLTRYRRTVPPNKYLDVYKRQVYI